MAEQLIFELTCGDIPNALELIRSAGIPIENLVSRDELTLRFQTERRFGTALRQLLEPRGIRLVRLRRLGMTRHIRSWLRRPILLASLALILWLTAWLPTRVLFIRVEGNRAVPARLILEKAERWGISFGADREAVRSERVKNALLEELPQLQWIGVNTSGCVATIQVRERKLPDPEIPPASEIVAVRDGMIRTCTIGQGTALCVPGQVVRAGQTLVSGLTDCGRMILVTGASGEIRAETSRSAVVRIDENCLHRGEPVAVTEKISLLIGKKRINFFKDSGILDGTCVKMYSEYYMTLPGGFRLPLGIGIETAEYYAAVDHSQPPDPGFMERYARAYLLSHMTAGEILEARTSGEGNRLYAHYICLEMIGQNRYEEFTQEDGKSNGENSECRTG